MKELFNIKMRASKWNKDKNESNHISGCERITNENSLEDVLKDLVYRAINHDKGKSDSINISIDKIDENKVIYIPCVDVTTIESETLCDGKSYIVELLNRVDVDDIKAEAILDILNSTSDMRGAIVFDVTTMKRVDLSRHSCDDKRGIRATGMDWDKSLEDELEKVLDIHGLNNNHVKEALVLASKVIYPRGVLAEICISDDPSYTTGYVSIKNQGYFRITNLKEKGSQRGGRIILFDSRYADIDEYIDFLENTITLINTVPNIN